MPGYGTSAAGLIMKQKHIVLAIVASVLVTIAPPVAGQDVPLPAAVAQPETKEPDKPEKEGANAAEPAAQKVEKKAEKKAEQKREQDLGFRWTDHPSLRLGPGTHIDFRARLQGNLQSSDVSLSEGRVRLIH